MYRGSVPGRDMVKRGRIELMESRRAMKSAAMSMPINRISGFRGMSSLDSGSS